MGTTYSGKWEPFYFLNTSINLSCLGRNYKIGVFSHQGHWPQHCWLLFPNISPWRTDTKFWSGDPCLLSSSLNLLGNCKKQRWPGGCWEIFLFTCCYNSTLSQFFISFWSTVKKQSCDRFRWMAEWLGNTYPCIHSPQTPLLCRLPLNSEQSSLCNTVGPCWLSILNIANSLTPSSLLATKSSLSKFSQHFWWFKQI